MSNMGEAGKTEYMPSSDAGKTEYMPGSDAGKTEYMPSNDAGKTEYMPSTEAGKTEYMGNTNVVKAENVSIDSSSERKETSKKASSTINKGNTDEKKKYTFRKTIKTNNHTYLIVQNEDYKKKELFYVKDENGATYYLKKDRAGDSVMYRAVDSDRQHIYYIKEYGYSYKNKEMFKDIGDFLLSCKHPGITRLLDYGELNEVDVKGSIKSMQRWYFIYPEYKPLIRPDEATFKIWVNTLNEALNEVHKNGLVHRDIKPSNIMIDPKTKLPVIIDFDAAATLNYKADGKIYAETNGAYITPEYAAPETRIESSGYAEPASDYFSLGVTFAEIYSGMNIAKPGVKSKSLFKNARDLNRQVLNNEVNYPQSVEDNRNVLKLIRALMCYNWRDRAGYNEVKEWLKDPEGFKHEASSANKVKFKYSIGTEVFSNSQELAEYLAIHTSECIKQWEQGNLFEYIEAAKDDFEFIYNGFREIKEDYEAEKKERGEEDRKTYQSWQKPFAYAIVHILDPFVGLSWNDKIYPWDNKGIKEAASAIVNDVYTNRKDFDPLFAGNFIIKYIPKLNNEENNKKLRNRLNVVSSANNVDLKKLLFAEILSPSTLVKSVTGGKKTSFSQYIDMIKEDVVNGGIDRAVGHYYSKGGGESTLSSFVDLCNNTYVVDAMLISSGYKGLEDVLSQKNTGKKSIKDVYNAIGILSAFFDEDFKDDVLKSKQGIPAYFLWHMQNCEKENDKKNIFAKRGSLAEQIVEQIYLSEDDYKEIIDRDSSPAMWQALGAFYSDLKEKIDIFYDFLIYDDEAYEQYAEGLGNKRNYIVYLEYGLKVYRFFDCFRINSVAKKDLKSSAKGLSIDDEPIEYVDVDIVPPNMSMPVDNDVNTDPPQKEDLRRKKGNTDTEESPVDPLANEKPEDIIWTEANCTTMSMTSAMMPFLPKAIMR